MASSEERSVAAAYSGRNVILTGVTGFLGKVILERLLWEFPDIGEIRLLLRPGSHSSGAGRFDADVLISPIFTRLRERHGGDDAFAEFLHSKTRFFAGDITRENLGLDAATYDELTSGLDMIIHSAALVDWDARLDNSIRNNTLGARQMLKIARSGGNAKLLHISTCWVHGQRRGNCPEKLPEVSFSVDEEVEAVLAYGKQADNESYRPDMMEQFQREATLRQSDSKKSKKALIEDMRFRWAHKHMAAWGVNRAISKGWWDNYTYSKALAETLLGIEHGEVPVAVVRPSGITGAMKDPEPGWTDAYLLTEPLIEGVGKKNITEFPGKPTTVIDTIPCDMVVNLCLVAGSALLKGAFDNKDEVPVFQAASNDTNPAPLGEIEKIWREHFEEMPFLDANGKPIVGIQPIKYWPDEDAFAAQLRRRYVGPLQFAQRVLEWVPGWENVGMLRNSRGYIVKQWRTVEKVLQLANLYSGYTLNEWFFETNKSREMIGALSLQDQERFNFDPRTINWRTYWKDIHIPGMRRYVLKEASFQKRMRMSPEFQASKL